MHTKFTWFCTKPTSIDIVTMASIQFLFHNLSLHNNLGEIQDYSRKISPHWNLPKS